MKLDDVHDQVLNDEIQRRESDEHTSSSVLHTTVIGRNSHNSLIIECWNCGKNKHYKNQYKLSPKNQETKASVTSTLGGEDTFICSLECKKESWVLDS